MPLVYHLLRFVLAAFLFLSAAGQLGYAPPPDPNMFTTEAWAFVQALQGTGYMMQTVGIVSALCGLAFLMNRYIALASIVLMPISINIVLFHVFLDAEPISVNASPAYLFFFLNLFMLYASRSRFDGVFLK